MSDRIRGRRPLFISFTEAYPHRQEAGLAAWVDRTSVLSSHLRTAPTSVSYMSTPRTVVQPVHN